MELDQRPGLEALVDAATQAAGSVDPLVLAPVGEPVGPPLAPREEKVAALGEMARLAGAVEALGPQPDPADELDRVALLFGLRRSTLVPVDGPLGARVMERHLLAGLSRLAQEEGAAVESLCELVEAGPAILQRSRSETVGGGAAAGQLALEAARRLPAILDACAGAVGSLPVALEQRTRVEAALGPLLQAAAEDSGWLLKEYIPGAGTGLARTMPDPLWAGLGFSLAELEAEAEGALATAVADLAEGQPPADDPAAGPTATRMDVLREWEAASLRGRDRFGIPATAAIAVREAPAWLRGLLPPLALLMRAPDHPEAALLLMANLPSAGLAEAVADVCMRDFLPAAAARANPRRARALLPAPELAEGWRSFAAPSPGGAELAWRAALALSALAICRGQADVEQAAQMIAAESGVGLERARLQAMQVAERPLAALTFLAGRRVLREAGARHGDQFVAGWLAEGPLPGAALRALAG